MSVTQENIQIQNCGKLATSAHQFLCRANTGERKAGWVPELILRNPSSSPAGFKLSMSIGPPLQCRPIRSGSVLNNARE